MDTTDKFLIGQEDALPALKAGEKDELGRILTEDRAEIPEKPGIEVAIRIPIPFEVLVTASGFVDGSIQGMIKSGEVVARACAVGGIPEALERDGQKMMTLCMACYDYVDALDVKKNFSPTNTSKTES